MLAQLHAHPRDSAISFRDEGHVYTIDGLEGHPISVTTVIHKFFPEFEEDLVIDKMMHSKNWPNSKYYGMTRDEIKKQWEDIRNEASHAGTAMHKAIEDFLNRPDDEQTAVVQLYADIAQVHSSVPDTPEFCHFLTFWSDLLASTTYRPYRTEWLVYDKDRRLAGSIDLILHDPTTDSRRIIILDWKRSKEIKFFDSFEKGRTIWRHLDNCNWNHYRLQLNMYRHLLETFYDKQVVEMGIVVFHPRNKSYIVLPVDRMEKEIVDLMQLLPLEQQPSH